MSATVKHTNTIAHDHTGAADAEQHQQSIPTNSTTVAVILVHHSVHATTIHRWRPNERVGSIGRAVAPGLFARRAGW